MEQQSSAAAALVQAVLIIYLFSRGGREEGWIYEVAEPPLPCRGGGGGAPGEGGAACRGLEHAFPGAERGFPGAGARLPWSRNTSSPRLPGGFSPISLLGGADGCR